MIRKEVLKYLDSFLEYEHSALRIKGMGNDAIQHVICKVLFEGLVAHTVRLSKHRKCFLAQFLLLLFLKHLNLKLLVKDTLVLNFLVGVCKLLLMTFEYSFHLLLMLSFL